MVTFEQANADWDPTETYPKQDLKDFSKNLRTT